MNRAEKILGLFEKVLQAMKFRDFKANIEKAFKKEFPKAWITSRYDAGYKNSMTIVFGVMKRNKLPNGIEHNDISRHVILIWGGTDDGVLAGKLSMEYSSGGSVLTKPDPNSFIAFGNVKTGLRNKKGDVSQILKHLQKYFPKLKKVVKDNIDNLTVDKNDLGF